MSTLSEVTTPAATHPIEPTGWHVLDARQFSRAWLDDVLFPLALRLQRGRAEERPKPLAGKRLFCLFYEPSTRTHLSFETAMTSLGGTATVMDGSRQDERLEDRIRTINAYGYDFVLLRYHEEGGARRAAHVSLVPVINAGDGMGQHPTQALLDAYTLQREFGRIDGLHIAIVGDLSYERTVHSLAYVLGQYRAVRLYLVSPHLLRMRDEVRAFLTASGAEVHETRDLRSVARQLDAVYLTRAHSSRLEHACRFDKEPGHYAVDAEVLALLPSHARILHPLPRGPELPAELDADGRVICFRQASNGLFVRMALLWLLGDANASRPFGNITSESRGS